MGGRIVLRPLAQIDSPILEILKQGLSQTFNCSVEIRALKEAVHELGHTYYLSHCADAKCVMYFSNSLADTDIKGAGFCKRCQQRLGEER